MAFAFLSEAGFEQGTKGNFDAQSPGTFTRAGFDHYTQLAARGDIRTSPYRGAYCFRHDLTNTTDHYIQENTDWDTSASGTIFFRMMVWFGGAPIMANNDIFSFFQLWSGTNTPEVSVGIQYTTANGYRFYFNETESATGAQFKDCLLNQWHCIEVKALIDSGGGNDGTIDGWVDGSAITQITALDQAAITSGVIGTLGVDAGTTQGVLLLDEVVADDARIYPPTFRYPLDLYLTASGHAVLGPCRIDNVSLYSGGATDNVLRIFDTDSGDINDVSKIKLELKNVTNSDIVDPAGVPLVLDRGCYVDLAGTNPRAMIKVGWAQAYGSDGALRSYALQRRRAPIGEAI